MNTIVKTDLGVLTAPGAKKIEELMGDLRKRAKILRSFLEEKPEVSPDNPIPWSLLLELALLTRLLAYGTPKDPLGLDEEECSPEVCLAEICETLSIPVRELTDRSRNTFPEERSKEILEKVGATSEPGKKGNDREAWEGSIPKQTAERWMKLPIGAGVTFEGKEWRILCADEALEGLRLFSLVDGSYIDFNR